MGFSKFIKVITAITFALCTSVTHAHAQGAMPGATSADAAVAGDDEDQVSAAKPKVPFDFDYFEELMAPVPNHEEERLCGLDKVCVTLWKKGQLQVDQAGHILNGDFNGDGISETAIVLEQNPPDAPADKSFLIYISQKQGETRKVLLHALLPEAKNILEMFWDDEKKAIVIDTGGRFVQTDILSSYNGSIYSYNAGKVQKVVEVVLWNPKTSTFDIIDPSKFDKIQKKTNKKKENLNNFQFRKI